MQIQGELSWSTEFGIRVVTRLSRCHKFESSLLLTLIFKLWTLNISPSDITFHFFLNRTPIATSFHAEIILRWQYRKGSLLQLPGCQSRHYGCIYTLNKSNETVQCDMQRRMEGPVWRFCTVISCHALKDNVSSE